MISLAGAGEILNQNEIERSYWSSNDDATFYTYDAYQGRQFKLRGIRTARYKYNWSPHDLCELYDLQNDPGERLNLIDSIANADIQAKLHNRLMAWMAEEGDYLLHTQHLLPVGSYVDGRGFEQQHDPGVWSEADKRWYASGKSDTM